MSMWSSHIPNLSFSPVLPVLCGRENDEDEGQQPGEGGTGAGEKKSEGTKSEGTGGSDADDHDGDPQKKIAAQEEIIARLARQREERDNELEELRKFRKEAEDAKLSDQEKIDQRIKELEESDSKKSATLQKLVVKNAFLSANDVAWHDPETALSLIDLSSFEIVVDGDGLPSIKDSKGFADAIAKLAKDKPFLVKTPTDDDEKPGARTWKGDKTGDAPKPKQSSQASERERLMKKFPALRGRG